MCDLGMFLQCLRSIVDLFAFFLSFFLSFGQTILHKLLLLCGVFSHFGKTSTYKEVLAAKVGSKLTWLCLLVASCEFSRKGLDSLIV